MRTKQDIEKVQDNISPEILPAIQPTIARSQKSTTLINTLDVKPIESDSEKRSFYSNRG